MIQCHKLYQVFFVAFVENTFPGEFERESSTTMEAIEIDQIKYVL